MLVGSASADWSEYQQNAQSTGFIQSTNAVSNLSELAWSFRDYTPTQYKAFAGVTLKDNRVCFSVYSPASESGTLYCLNAITGEKLWQTGGTFMHFADSGSQIYTIQRRSINAYHSENGSVAWSKRFESGMTTFGGVSLAQDKVFVGTIIRSNVKGILFALNKNDGSEIWNVSFGRGGASKPAYSNGKVFVGTRDNRAIYSINSNNGSVFWSKGLAGWAGHPSVSDGKVYIMGGKTLYCLDEATGNTIWSQNFSSGSLAAPAIAYGKVFVGIGNSLYSLDKDSGAIILNASVGGIRSPLAISNEMVYFQSNSDIFNYDANTGDLISTYRMYSLGAPIAIGANRVYAAGNKKLYAFGGSDELDLSISDVKPVQVVYDADINGDGKIDLVQGKSAVALVYLDTENFEDLDND